MSKPISVKEFSSLTDVLYEGIQEDIPWKTFLNSLKSQMHAQSATLTLRSQPKSVSSVTISSDNGDDRNTLHTTSTEFRTRDGASCSLRISRGPGSEGFSPSDKEILELLAPHLKSAVRIYKNLDRVRSERNLYAEAVNQLAIGTILLDEESRIIKMNPVARELINDNSSLKVSGKVLQAGNTRDNRKLREMIRRALGNNQCDKPFPVEALRVQRLSGISDLGIIVRPVPVNRWLEGSRYPSAVIFISDPERKSAAPQEIIKTLFELTPAEAQLTMLLANGLTLDEAAETLKVSRNTARAHLRSIFSKTGVTRQTMLVRLILKSVATLASVHNEA